MTPSEGKDSDSSDSRKTFNILFFFFTFSVYSFGFFSLPPPIVVVDFIGTAAAAAAASLQSCPTLCDPIDGSPQAPPSLGFSRQEHCSGLPFPSPMHESEK